jgi:hypothetical protein
MNRRSLLFRCCDADREHQRLAGIASWAAFSARWRARQGLPLLHPMDVQYLTPQDFCDGCGQPLPPRCSGGCSDSTSRQRCVSDSAGWGLPVVISPSCLRRAVCGWDSFTQTFCMGETIWDCTRLGPCLQCVPTGCRWHLVALTRPASATGWMGQRAMKMTTVTSPGLRVCGENCLCKRGVWCLR